MPDETLVTEPPSAPPATDATPPPPAADAAPPPPAKITDAQAARFAKHAKNVLGISFDEEKPPEPPKKEEKAPEAPAADAPPPPAAKAAPPKKTPPRVVPSPPERDRHEENKELATSVAKAVASELKPKADAAPSIELSEEDQVTVGVLEKMGEMFPEHKATAAKYRSALIAQTDYETRWQAAHPEETFDPDSEDHRAFYERNLVEYPEKLFHKAQARIEAEEVAKPLRQQLETEKKERIRLQRIAESEPEIRKEQAEAAKMAADQFEDGPENLDPATMAKYAEEHPLEAQFYGHAMNATAQMARVSHQLFTGLVEYDKANAAHVEVARAANDLESSLLALPVEERLDGNGKLFLASNEFHALPAAKQSKYWTVDAKALNEFIAGKNAEHAKIQVKSQREWIAKVTKQPIQTNGSKPNGAPNPPAKVDPKPLVAKPKTESPGATTEPLVPRGQGAPTKVKGSAPERFMADMLG